MLIGEIVHSNSFSNGEQNGIYNILYILKLVKMRYAFNVIDKIFDVFKLNAQGDIRRLIKLAIALGLTVHVMACMHAFMGIFLFISY